MLSNIMERLARHKSDFGIFAEGDFDLGRDILAQSYKLGFSKDLAAVYAWWVAVDKGKTPIKDRDVEAAYEVLSSAGEDVGALTGSVR